MVEESPKEREEEVATRRDYMHRICLRWCAYEEDDKLPHLAVQEKLLAIEERKLAIEKERQQLNIWLEYMLNYIKTCFKMKNNKTVLI